MRILLDCRPLQNGGGDPEKRRRIFTVAGVLSREAGVEWLLVVDHTYRKEVSDLPAMPTISLRSLPGRPGWKLWYDWQIPRLVKKEKPDAVMLTGGVGAGP